MATQTDQGKICGDAAAVIDSIKELGKKMITMKSILRSILILLILGSAGVGEFSRPSADSGKGLALFQRALENIYGEDCLQVIELTASSGGRAEATRTLQIIRSQRERPGHSLIRFTEPADVRSISILINEREAGLADVFLYVPAERRSRRISGAQRGDAFFGTNLTFEDVEAKHIEDFTVLGEIKSEVARPCVILEVEPANADRSSYRKMHFCIDGKEGILHWIRYFVDDRFLKELVIDQKAVREIGGRHVPVEMEMRSVEGSAITRIRTKKYVRLEHIPALVFSQRNLESGDAEGDRRKLGIQ
jgi:Outer membrane lipoprotein-sorting protein